MSSLLKKGGGVQHFQRTSCFFTGMHHSTFCRGLFELSGSQFHLPDSDFSHLQTGVEDGLTCLVRSRGWADLLGQLPLDEDYTFVHHHPP